MKDISIIIVNWNVQDQIAECLASLTSAGNESGVDQEVIVVDNASTDQSVNMIRHHFPSVKLIENKDNVGFAKACNQAIRMSEGQYILLLNPDTTVPPHAIPELLAFAREHPNAGVIGPKIVNPDGTPQPSVRRFPTIWNQTFIQLKLHHLFKRAKVVRSYLMDEFDYKNEGEVDQVMGAAFLIPRSVIEELGSLDERFFVWFEEVDFCRRVKNQGKQVLYFPNTYIVHKQGQSFFQLESTSRQRMMNHSLIKYFYKNHGLLQGLWFIGLHPVSMTLAYLSQLIKIRPKAL